MHKILTTVLFAGAALVATAQHHVRIINTSDIHGNYLPYDFIEQKEWGGGLSRVASYVKEQRGIWGKDRVVLLDNGDILQGQPTAYYYNYVDTTRHLCAAALNYLEYDVAVMGNHDIEAGHRVYDRYTEQCYFPILAANAINTKTGEPYWRPYTIVNRDGLRIAVLGLITPGIPMWLPENLWSGIRFEDMVTTARRWMRVLKEEEKPDVIVGVFHSGVGSPKASGALNENASLQVAREVPGFDLVLCGHDHRQADRRILNVAGDSVLVLNPAANGFLVTQADIYVDKENGEIVGKPRVEGRLVNIERLAPDAEYMARFAPQMEAVKRFTGEKIGHLATRLDTRPAYFGSSAFIDLLHEMQLKITRADLSFAAPLSFDAAIEAGDIRVADMFSLYKFENLLYVMEMTGREVKDYLEHSYDGWIQTMRSPKDHLLLFRPDAEKATDGWQRLKTPAYNFDCAGGIVYTVDVRKNKGERIHIECFADGRKFDMNACYKVAVNSYRGNGGGGLMENGAGIPKGELKRRVLWSSDRDFRHYLMEAIRSEGNLSPKAKDEWKFIPEKWVKKARERDEKLLFQGK